MVVPLPQEDDGTVMPDVELGVPLPAIVMPIFDGTVMPVEVVQVQEPEGIWMISPSTAVCVGPLMTASTSAREQVAAVNVPAHEAADSIKTAITILMRRNRLCAIQTMQICLDRCNFRSGQHPVVDE